MRNLKRNCCSSDDRRGSAVIEDIDVSEISKEIITSTIETSPDKKRRIVDSLDTLLPLLLEDDYDFNFDYDLFSPIHSVLDNTDFLVTASGLGPESPGVPVFTSQDLQENLEASPDTTGSEDSVINELSLWVDAVNNQGEEEIQKLQHLYAKNNLFGVTIQEIPKWITYYADQKYNMIPKYSENEPHIPIDENINSKISFWFDDITVLKVDAIVNSTTYHFSGENGVDKSIHAAAGEMLKKRCQEKLTASRLLDVGEATLTESFCLPSKFVIHTNGPCGEVPFKLTTCYENCLNVLLENNLKTIAFPCISTGKKGYPQANAARIALQTIRYFLQQDVHHKIDRVILCLFNDMDISIYLRLMQVYFPIQEETRINNSIYLSK